MIQEEKYSLFGYWFKKHWANRTNMVPKVITTPESKRTNNLGTLVSAIHTHSEMKWDALLGFVLLSWGQIQPLDNFERVKKKEKKKRTEEEAKEGEATRSIGHRILPLGPATGHCAGAEFHHLQEKKEVLMQWGRENVRAKALNRLINFCWLHCLDWTHSSSENKMISAQLCNQTEIIPRYYRYSTTGAKQRVSH